MHKYLISSAIVLTLFGCGGGESGGSSSTPSPTVKYYNVSFFDLDNVAENDQNSCQIFGYNDDKTRKVIAYRSVPETKYEVIIHHPDGSVHTKYTNFSKTTLRLTQNEVPNGGYISFAEFNSDGISHITTFAKELLPSTVNIYAKSKSTQSCLTGENPQLITTTGYIDPIDWIESYRGFNFYNQSLDSLTTQYTSAVQSHTEINFSAPNKPLLAVSYEKDSDTGKILELKGFKFTPFSQKGTAAIPLKLNPVPVKNSPWTLPNTVELDSANIFVDGRQFNAPYAYLWQQLTTEQDGQFSYSNDILDRNYYLNIKGKQLPNGNPIYWGIQHVTQGTENNGASLTTSNILNNLPQAEVPTLIDCQADTQQCISINSSDLSSNTIQRVWLDAKLRSGNDLIQVLYTPLNDELPIMKFDRDLDEGISSFSNASISFIDTDSALIQETFFYQHQNLFNRVINNELRKANVDNIPLLQNITDQQAQQDLLKRQAYTWLWLEENNG
ncbi:hypothetical protein L4F31_11120 [Vibrio paracholerae]|uniref:hypothetical protein n=1 Tax=Vibrio paracholerae TaxID=650003 RepID=UPI002095FF50|nr:hypothetical protein [Vibrio paracholerae]MCO7023794.1 hypothetical protein [Vibrio paracholerae]